MRDEAAFVLDSTILAECARGDTELIGMIQQFDADGVTLVVPALAVSAAVMGIAERPERSAVVRGICRLASAEFAGLVTFDDAVELARARAYEALLREPWDAHVAEAALNRRVPILTLDGERWKNAVRDISGELAVVVVADLGE
ncbi:hypothetical protein DP939_26725 [Spongiactinospora rosea]|uniref:PIN domain-containing protein n=1 Tax=Spongiactinospora rosea TaxID=2248750 RepID=A0A366LT11_9ACTN|nr:hypothetical protein [Spongiactinospora rosea]RBQ17085.1 hypothetical protein DP939_26725 [Spongiactinospora rosea]